MRGIRMKDDSPVLGNPRQRRRVFSGVENVFQLINKSPALLEKAEKSPLSTLGFLSQLFDVLRVDERPLLCINLF